MFCLLVNSADTDSRPVFLFDNSCQNSDMGKRYHEVEAGEATWDLIRVRRNATRKARAHLELNLAKDVKGINKGFFKYLTTKIITWENVVLLLPQPGDWGGGLEEGETEERLHIHRSMGPDRMHPQVLRELLGP